MTPETISLLLGTVGMAIGVVVVGLLVRATDADATRGRFAALGIVPGAAAVAYLVMALGIGEIAVQGVAVPVPRYVDWLVTTPVLIGYAAYVAGASRRAIVAAGVVDAAMIVIGWVGVVTTGPARLAAFVVSSLCYVGLLAALYAVFPRTARDQPEERRQLFRVLQNHVGLLWVAYPVMWAAGPLGVGLVDAASLTLLITFADVAAKTPYVYFVYVHRRAFSVEADAGGAPGRDPAPSSGDESVAAAD